MLKIGCVFSGLGGDSDNFTSSICEFENLGDTGLGIERVCGDHGLNPDWIPTAHADAPNIHFARASSLVAKEVWAVTEMGGFGHPEPFYRGLI